MLTMFNAKKRLVGNAGPSGKFCIRNSAPFFSQEFRQPLVEVASHAPKVAKTL